MMDGPSRTAVLMAVARALHRDEPGPWGLDDELGVGVAGPDAAEVRAELLALLPRPSLLAFSRWACVRARVPEVVVEDALESGIGQYVVLGAGLDTLAYRRADLIS